MTTSRFPAVTGPAAEAAAPSDDAVLDALRQSEARFRAAFEQSPSSMIIYDAEGRALEVNPAFERLWGIGLADIPAGYSVLTDPQLLAAGIVPIMRRAFQGEPVTTPPILYDVTKTAGGGHVRWTQAYLYPVRDGAGIVRQVVLTHEDVTDRLAAERALRASEERYRALVEAHTDLVWLTDARGMVEDLPGWRAMTGQTAAEVRGEGWLAAIHPDDRAATAATWWQAYATRATYVAEYRLRMADGRYRRMRSRGVPVLQADGAIREWVGTLDDIEEETAAQAAVREAQERAERHASEATALAAQLQAQATRLAEANRAKSDFLAAMSHELRTPLNAITGYTDLLELELRGPLTPEQRDDLARIRRSAQHLLALITDILNFTRLEAGRVEFRDEVVPVGAALADLQVLMGPQIAANALAFSCEVEDATLAVRGDPERVQQILLNLLSNAVKFTAPGGRIAISAAPRGDGRTVRVLVRDTGRGIAPEQHERIFEPFVQVDRQLTTGGQQGVGLGLAISRDLARRMGGELTVESAPGRGSTFLLDLPVA